MTKNLWNTSFQDDRNWFFLPDFFFLNVLWIFFFFFGFLISWYVQMSVNGFDVYGKSSLDKCNDHFVAVDEIALMLFL